MLVPSTFTGWYKKMMMKAEIAREMMRSLTQTPSTGTTLERRRSIGSPVLTFASAAVLPVVLVVDIPSLLYGAMAVAQKAAARKVRTDARLNQHGPEVAFPG